MTDNQKLIKQADIVFSLLVRSFGLCQQCGNSNPKELDCAHLFRRSNMTVRFNFKNSFCLCRLCHSKAHADEKKFHNWAQLLIGSNVYRTLKKEASMIASPDWKEILKSFEDQLLIRFQIYGSKDLWIPIIKSLFVLRRMIASIFRGAGCSAPTEDGSYLQKGR